MDNKRVAFKEKRLGTLTNALGRDDPFDGRVEVLPLDFTDCESLVESLRGVRSYTTHIGYVTRIAKTAMPMKLQLKISVNCSQPQRKLA